MHILVHEFVTEVPRKVRVRLGSIAGTSLCIVFLDVSVLCNPYGVHISSRKVA